MGSALGAAHGTYLLCQQMLVEDRRFGDFGFAFKSCSHGFSEPWIVRHPFVSIWHQGGVLLEVRVSCEPAMGAPRVGHQLLVVKRAGFAPRHHVEVLAASIDCIVGA